MKISTFFRRLFKLHTEIYLAKDDLYHLDTKLCKMYLIRKRLRNKIKHYERFKKRR